MVFDETAADRAVRALAALTDEQQAADILGAVDEAVAAWATWRTDPAYPRPGDPQRGVMAGLDAVVRDVATAARGLPADARLETVVDLAGRLLGMHVPDCGPVVVFADAVEKLRYLTKSRTRLVDDARRLVAKGMA